MSDDAMSLVALIDPRNPGRIRGDIRESLRAYAREGIPLGSFLQAVIANDLVDAAARADSDNVRALPAIAAFVYCDLPSPCWGSRRCYDAWLKFHLARRAGDEVREAAAHEEVQAAYDESRRWMEGGER